MSRRRTNNTILWVLVGLLLAALIGLTVYTVKVTDKMQGVITQLQGDLSKDQTVIHGSENEVERLRAELAEQQKTIEEQKSTIEEQKGTIEEQKGTIEEQKGTIESQKGTIEEQKDTIEEQKETIESQKGTIDNLKVQIAQKKEPSGDYTGQKIVALTFDDGPGPYTERLLDALQERGARATFFVVGTRVNSYAKLLRRMDAEGHVVGNHSNEHKMLHNMSLAGVRDEMGKCAEKIEKILGHLPTLMRCPGGNSSSIVKQYAQEAGIPILYWSVDTRDWESKNKDAILDISKKNIKDGSIVLMHDIYSTSVDAAIELMDWLIEEGYTMVTVPELLNARRGGIEAGKTYS